MACGRQDSVTKYIQILYMLRQHKAEKCLSASWIGLDAACEDQMT